MAHIKGADEEHFTALGSSTEKIYPDPRLFVVTQYSSCCFPVRINDSLVSISGALQRRGALLLAHHYPPYLTRKLNHD